MPITFRITFLTINYLYGFIANALGSALTVVLFFNQKIKNENFGVELLASSLTEEQVQATDSSAEIAEIDNTNKGDTGTDTGNKDEKKT